MNRQETRAVGNQLLDRVIPTKFVQTCDSFHKRRFNLRRFMKSDLDMDNGRVR